MSIIYWYLGHTYLVIKERILWNENNRFQYNRLLIDDDLSQTKTKIEYFTILTILILFIIYFLSVI